MEVFWIVGTIALILFLASRVGIQKSLTDLSIKEMGEETPRPFTGDRPPM